MPSDINTQKQVTSLTKTSMKGQDYWGSGSPVVERRAILIMRFLQIQLITFQIDMRVSESFLEAEGGCSGFRPDAS